PAALTATTSTAAAVGEGVSAKSRGKASAKKRGTSTTVSSSLTTLDPGILSSLGVTLSPEGVQVIASLFFKIGEFARGVYRSMLDKQLPSSVSDKLSVTGRAIWYYTYSTMCKDFFMSRCISEYHASHRPGFVRALPSIQVVSDSSGHSAFSLAGENLLSFLSNLDGAIHSELESIFNSCFSDVSVSLEEESLSDVSCEDFVDVLNVAGVPKKVLLSTELLGSRVKVGKKSAVFPADNVFPAHVETTRVIRAPVWVPPFANAYELSLLSSARNSRAGTSSDQVAAEGLAGDVPVSTHVETRAVCAPVLVLPSAGDDTPSYSAVSIPSYLECADSLGVELHPDSVPLIHNFFRRVRLSIEMSFLGSIRKYISTAMSSVLSVIGRFVWFTTYREQHLYNFISRCLVLYHYKYRPDFIRTLPDIRVLSDSSDLGLQLSGGSLVSFLSRLDLVVRDLISCVFNSQWGIEVDKVCSEIGDGSLDGFGCEDLIYVLDIAGVPESVLSVSQRRKESAKKRKESAKRRREGTPGSSSCKITSEGTASVGGIEGHSLLSQESYDRSPSRSPAITVPVVVSTVFGESSSNVSDDVLDSTVEGAASSLDVLEGESLSP
ncbi:hypothetical protein, partial [Candidatus Ichthyocystis sparus]|uniref:hypothetical protein n=1 Tax=Candidatus Ichthyocystis sparus TaxID=1561004 RepID=UPI00159ECB26